MIMIQDIKQDINISVKQIQDNSTCAATVPSIRHSTGGLTKNTDMGHSVRRMPKLY